MKTVLLATAIIFCLPTSQVMSGTIPGSVSTTLVEPEVDFASLDEITLITGEVIDGVILKRLANFVVYIDDRGVERMEPAGIIKHIRKAGSLETISLAEALGRRRRIGEWLAAVAPPRGHEGEARRKDRRNDPWRSSCRWITTKPPSMMMPGPPINRRSINSRDIHRPRSS